jgi:hypothetical protein
MFRLGFHLTLRGGREGLVRLLVTTLAVGIGVGLLLSVLAVFQAYSSTIGRPCWECTSSTSDTGALLWNYSQDYYDGATIERLDVAALSAGAPTMPGLTHMPAAGQYYASPALAKLLAQTPKDLLGARFPGTLTGTPRPNSSRSRARSGSRPSTPIPAGWAPHSSTSSASHSARSRCSCR